MGERLPTRAQAARVLDKDMCEVMRLLDRLSPSQLRTPGLGGGEWSPADLIGHLESWEEHALGALEAWAEGGTAPIDKRLRTEGLNGVNRREVERKAKRSPARALRSAASTHSMLIAAIDAMADPVWRAPATSRAKNPLGLKLGAILGGPAGPFRHGAAHLPDLRAFVEQV